MFPEVCPCTVSTGKHSPIARSLGFARDKHRSPHCTVAYSALFRSERVSHYLLCQQLTN